MIGLVGCGYWGRNLCRNLYNLGVLRVVCDSSPETLAWVRGEYPSLATTSDLSEVLADASIQAVAIASPAVSHFQMTKDALLAGKDVLVEKPLALHEEDGDELLRVARERDRVLMVGHLLEYHPAVRKLHGLVREGELGDVRYLLSSRLNLGKVRQEEDVVWSFAPHDVAVILRLAGQAPQEVIASGAAFLQPGIRDVASLSLQFADGAWGHIMVSWLHPFKEQRLVVVGSRKMAVFDDVSADRKLVLHDCGAQVEGGVPQVRREGTTHVAVEAAEPLRLECEHFVQCVVSRQHPLTDGESGLAVLRVLGAARRSLEAGGAPVPLHGQPVRAQRR
ncbi:MAG: Gfo/Idh/MocA family oxidoreductase [Chloroflexi bacterium]|nr:Gfo/Idh/MocA family oxidoreductase [Chloroflexota bacterium]